MTPRRSALVAPNHQWAQPVWAQQQARLEYRTLCGDLRWVLGCAEQRPWSVGTLAMIAPEGCRSRLRHRDLTCSTVRARSQGRGWTSLVGVSGKARGCCVRVIPLTSCRRRACSCWSMARRYCLPARITPVPPDQVSAPTPLFCKPPPSPRQTGCCPSR